MLCVAIKTRAWCDDRQCSASRTILSTHSCLHNIHTQCYIQRLPRVSALERCWFSEQMVQVISELLSE